MKRRPPKVAVVVPLYNASRHIRPLIEGLAKQDYSHWKAYFIDDKSKDSTREDLKKELQKRNLVSHLIENEINRGPAATRNIAIKQALAEEAELVLLLDCDCRVSSDWVSRHVQTHQDYPDTSAVGGGIEGVASTWVGKADGFGSWFTGIPHSPSGYATKLHLSSTNLSFKSEVFAQIGFFDEDLATGEDVAFCRRLVARGLKQWFQSDIVVRHLDRNDIRAAQRHHYRWGLHSYNLSTRSHGGYYDVLKRIPWPQLAVFLIPCLTLAHTAFILLRYSRWKPSVWLYVPWIVYLKWHNALGVYRGLRDPTLCLHKPVAA